MNSGLINLISGRELSESAEDIVIEGAYDKTGRISYRRFYMKTDKVTHLWMGYQIIIY